MEIENNRIGPPPATGGNQGAPVEKQNSDNAGADRAQGDASTGGADRVSLTGTARQLQALENQVANQPVVDSQRVDAVRQAVASGTFNVDAERIADKVIDLEQALTDAR